VLRLDAGDYYFLDYANEPVGIEQSEISNLVQKLRSGELESQMYNCQKLFTHVILLIQGVYDRSDELLAIYKKGHNGYFRSHIYPRTTFAAIKAVEVSLSGMGIEIISSPNFECSMDVIRTIYAQRTKSKDEHTLFKKIRKVQLPVKLSANPAVPKLMTLIPRIPEKVAIALIYRYNTIWNVIHATDNELQEVDGMGRGLVKKLRESIGQED